MVEGALHVHRHHLVPFGVAGLEDVLGEDHRGIVDQDVEAAEGIEGAGHRGVGGRALAHVAADDGHAVAEGAEALDAGIDVLGDDGGAELVQQLDRGASQPARGAGHDGDAVTKAVLDRHRRLLGGRGCGYGGGCRDRRRLPARR